MANELHIGQVLWHVCCPADEYPDGWYAKPGCIEYLDEHKFLFGDHTGGSLNCVGHNYFLTREDALKDHERYKNCRIYQPNPRKKEPQIGRRVEGDINVDDIETKVYKGIFDEPIDTASLEWHYCSMTEAGWLTLDEIRAQLANKGITFFTVFHDGMLHGEIYVIGNYNNDDKFWLFGETMGYA